MSGEKRTVNLINYGDMPAAQVKEAEDKYAAQFPPDMKEFASILFNFTVDHDIASNMGAIAESMSRNRPVDSNRKKKAPQTKKAAVREPEPSGKANEEEERAAVFTAPDSSSRSQQK